MWRDTRDPIFMLDLSLPISTDLPLLANILRDYTLEFKIRVERAFADLRECPREAVRDRDYCRGLAPVGIEAECGQLRSRVAGLEDELAALTCRVAALDHTWDEEKATLEASDRADGSALELVQARSYIHSTLSMEFGQEGDEPSEPQLAFHHLQTELVEREEALRVTIIEVGIL